MLAHFSVWATFWWMWSESSLGFVSCPAILCMQTGNEIPENEIYITQRKIKCIEKFSSKPRVTAGHSAGGISPQPSLNQFWARTNVQILMQHPCNAQPLKYQCQLNLTLVSDPGQWAAVTWLAVRWMAKITTTMEKQGGRRPRVRMGSVWGPTQLTLNRRSYIEAWSHDSQ